MESETPKKTQAQIVLQQLEGELRDNQSKWEEASDQGGRGSGEAYQKIKTLDEDITYLSGLMKEHGDADAYLIYQAEKDPLNPTKPSVDSDEPDFFPDVEQAADTYSFFDPEPISVMKPEDSPKLNTLPNKAAERASQASFFNASTQEEERAGKINHLKEVGIIPEEKK